MRKKYRTRRLMAMLLSLILSTGEIAGSGFYALAAGEEEVVEESEAIGEAEAGEEAKTADEAELSEEDAEYAGGETEPGEAHESEDGIQKEDEPDDEVIPESDPDGADLPVEKKTENTMLSNYEMADAVEPASEKDPWKGSFVYYGKYEGMPVKYRVLAHHNCDFTHDWEEAMLLDCDEILYYMKYESDNCKGPIFQKGGLRESLNGNGFLENDVFSAPEKRAILSSTKLAPNAKDGTWEPKHYSTYDFGKLSDTKIFVMDAREASNTSYGYQDTVDKSKSRIKSSRVTNISTQGNWWLRSSHVKESPFYAEYVPICDETGDMGGGGLPIKNWKIGVSPAFNLDVNAIILSTAVSGEKGAVNAEYKLTMWDPNMQADMGNYGKEVVTDMIDRTLTVHFRIMGEDAAEADAVSILIQDKEYERGNGNNAKLLYYGTLDCGDSFETRGRGTFRLPDELDVDRWGKDYHVYLMAEDRNAARESDYASRPCEITTDVYKIKEYYGMTFDFQGHGYSDSPMYTPKRYNPGEKPYKPLDPKEEGWIFKGWYTSATDHSDAAKFDFSQPLTGSVAVYAWWVKEHKVTFRLNDGSKDDVFKVVSAEDNTYVVEPEEIPQRKGYEFQGWSFSPDSGSRLTNHTIKADTDVYAIWKNVKTYSVGWDMNGKTVTEEPQMLHVIYGNKAEEPKKPQATEGWEFLGWYKDSGCTDGNEFDFENELITEDIILHAKWSDKLKLWVDGTQVDASNCDNEAFSYDIARHELTLKDLTFSKTDAEIPSETIPARAVKPYVAYIYADGMDITIKGKARMSGEEDVNIAGILVGGTATLDGDFEISDTGAAIYARNVIINGGSIKAVSKVIGCDDKDGNTKMPYGIWASSSIEFNGGTTDIDLIDAVDGYALAVRAGDISINDGEVHLKVQEYTDAKLIKNHGKVNNSLNILGPAGVAFDAGRQCFVDAYGEDAVEVRLGKGENPWCIVSFSVNGMDTVAPADQSVKRGTKARVPVSPFIAGYEFLGWYKNAACEGERFIFDEPIMEDTILYAKWEKAVETDTEEHPELLLSTHSPLDPVPMISLLTTELYLVKGQKFIIPDCWVIKRDDTKSKKVISISKKGQFKAKKAGDAQIWYGDRCVEVHVCQPKVTKSLKLEVGQNESNRISVSGIDPVGMPVLFQSADPDVASVDQNGDVYAYTKGSVVITAYINGSAYKCKVTVTEKNGTPRERNMHVISGSTKPVKVKIKGVKKPEWISSDPEVAELNASKTKVKTKKPGLAVLTAKASEDPLDTYTVYVLSEDIRMKGSYLEGGKNNKYTLKLNLEGRKCTAISAENVMQPVIFKSSKPDIAFMDENGQVTARRKGKAKFTAKIDGKTITINVVVE